MSDEKRPRLLIVKTGSAFAEAIRRHGDFDDWFRRALGEECFGFDTVNVHEHEPLPEADAIGEYAGVVVTGSPAMVSHRHEWSEKAAAWLANIIDRDAAPLLGVCYGHQLIAHALGGRVGPNPHGRRMGTVALEWIDTDDPLTGALEQGASVHVTHLEAVLDPPPGARVIGHSQGDPYHVLHFGGRSWGVQFHPEFTAGIMRCYIEARASLLDGEGLDPNRLLQAVTETDSGTDLLARFGRLCLRQQSPAHAPIT